MPAQALANFLGAPTLFEIKGKSDKFVLFTVLLHGNEHTGYYAVRDLLKEFHEQNKTPENNIFFFIANVHATEKNLRHLDGQPDFNRIWKNNPDTQDFIDHVVRKSNNNLQCSIDFHNNTGDNPLYSCMHDISHKTCNLAYDFSPTAIYFDKPEEAHVVAFANHTTAITVECGLSNHEAGYIAAKNLAHKQIQTKILTEDPSITKKLTLYDSNIRLRIPENQINNFAFRHDLDKLNFLSLEEDILIGNSKNGLKLDVDTRSQNKGELWIKYQDNNIYLRAGMMPAMLTNDKKVIEQDCLGYLMHEMHINASENKQASLD